MAVPLNTFVDDFLRSTGKIADYIVQNPQVKTFVDDITYYPTTAPYNPSPYSESVGRRFLRGASIGFQEGVDNKRLVMGKQGGYSVVPIDYNKRIANDLNDSNWVAYNRSIFEPIKETAYLPHRQDPFNQAIAVRDVPSQIGMLGGRLVGDITGFGTRKWAWNLNPEDFLGTTAGIMVGNPDAIRRLGLEPTKGLQNAARFGTATGLGLSVGNWDITNLGEGGRPKGYEAISPTANDPTKSTQPVFDLAVSRGLLGRNSRLLPWEQFRLEKPNVTYDEYQQYRDYLYNRDPGLLSKATFGLVKGTPNSLDEFSPELRIVGYRVTPQGILGATAGGLLPVGVAAGINAIRNSAPSAASLIPQIPVEKMLL